MRENFPGAGEQSDSSVVLTVLATTFTFVEWENNPFPPIIWDMTCLPDALEDLCQPRDYSRATIL